MKQYYYIEFESHFLWRDDEKLIFNSLKELKDWIKNDVRYMLSIFDNGKHDTGREAIPDVEKIKKLYRRINKLYMYENNDGLLLDSTLYPKEDFKKMLGLAFELDYEDKSGDFERFMTYYCHRVKKNELHKFADFREIE